MIRHEIRELHSTYIDGTLMYPGKWMLTWIKVGVMPWQLAGMEQLP